MAQLALMRSSLTHGFQQLQARQIEIVKLAAGDDVNMFCVCS